MVTQTDVRLPTNVRPVNYLLTLTPELEKFTFAGEETIDIEIREATNRIELHALELEISHCDVKLPDGTTIPSQNIEMDAKAETAIITLGSAIPAGSAALNLRFTGILNDQLRGFYRSQYIGPGGETKYLATTQFEATDARRAFPCWDEPAVKATYQVTLVVPQDLAAICNNAEESVTPVAGGLKAVRFKETPKMSTYLLAFIVGDLACVQDSAPNGTLVRVWATRGREEQGRFALQNGIRILSFFNGYFGIPFPLEKLDHIAIPDFAAGAMENWGAITYRETALLYDPVNSAAFTRQRILEVVAHEMAHMWFGDLVTMEWWDDLWLNESFASWIGDKAVDNLYPDWQMWTQFVSHDTNGGLSLDALRNSHPIEAPVYDPAQIRELFDAISYNKGAAVLRMLEDYIGEASFQRGLQAYLSKHQYANARTEDLWSALGQASGMPVSEVMGSWIRQTGFPLLQARAEQQGDDVALKLSQRRFLYEHLLDDTEDDPTLWKVPVTATGPNADAPTRVLMEGREGQALLGRGSVASGGWTKVNSGQTGFYRVNYIPEDWDKLQAAVLKLELPTIDRLGLQNDAYALARGGYLPATRFLSLAESFKNETDATVWTDLAVNLGGIENLLLQQSYLEKFDTFGQNLFRDIVRRVGWDAKPNEGQLDAILRSTVLSMAGGYGDPEVIAEAKARFSRFLTNPASLHPDLRGIVVGIVGQEGDRATYDTLWELARRADLQEEKLRFLRGVARFKQADLLRTTLERALSDDVRSQDSVTVIGSVSGNRIGRQLAWDFIKDNWAELDRRYGRGGFAIASLVGVTGGFTSLDKAKEVGEFFETHHVPSARRTIQQSLERIRINAKWLERNGASLSQWFASS